MEDFEEDADSHISIASVSLHKAFLVVADGAIRTRLLTNLWCCFLVALIFVQKQLD